MAREVCSCLVQILVATCAHGGMDVTPLFSGLGFRKKDLADPASRVDWEDFTILLDRILEACGSAKALETLMTEIPRATVPPEVNLHAFPDLQTFFLWMASSPTRVLHSNLQTTARLSENGLILCEHYIPRPFRPCRALAITSLGFFKGVPRIFGLPDAEVSCTFDDRCGLYLVDLSVSCSAYLARPKADCENSFSLNKKVPRFLFGEIERYPWVVEAGQDLLQAESLTDLGYRIGKWLSGWGNCPSGRLWIRRTEGDMEMVHNWGAEPVPSGTHLLSMGARILGRVEVSPPEALEQEAQQMLLSWACIAIDHVLERPAPSRLQEIAPGSMEDMGLTPRQRQVLFLLVQGLSDKEIAQTTGTSPKTVGHQVSLLLKKGGVTSRTALAHRCLSN